jgi:hypothetical protein
MELNSQQLSQIIELLESADGEDLQFILKQIGMDDQVLKQLVFSASDLQLRNCIEERECLIEKPFWDNVRDTEMRIKEESRKVWDDMFNNDTLIYGDFDSYWESKK